jgi:16S rRNA (uracil1498-N3)-methyltransferase
LSQRQRLVVDPQQIQADRVNLSKEQLHYLTRVLRLKSGEPLIIMDGQGQTWESELVETQAKLLSPIVVQSELPIALTLAIAISKTGFDDVLRQVTELGVTKIVPIISDRTIVKPDTSKLSRWQKIIQEAAEQSERAIVPPIIAPIHWKQHLKSPSPHTTHFLCWERSDSPSLLSHLKTPHPAIEIAIGPEGGWTEAEIHQAIATGYQPVSLGKRILRATTANIAAIAILAAHLEAPP